MENLYTIIEVATKLGLSDKTLRRWEEAGRFTPSRTLGNQRRYTLEDLQILDAIKHGTVNGQKDLLTVDQAGKLCGVSPTTIMRWEDMGKIHPLITSGNTYYPRQKLMEKMELLKGTVPERNPRLQAEEGSSADEGTVPNVEPRLSPLTSPQASPIIHYSSFIIHALVTLLLLFSYHLLFNQPSAPVSPQVQGASISTVDPRLDDLITKFQDHLQSEMLEKAKPQPISNTFFGTGTLLKNQNQILVSSVGITPSSAITVTFTSDFSPAKKYWVTPASDSFTLHTDFPVGADSTFNYSFLALPASPSAILR